MQAALVILDGWGIGRYWPVADDGLGREPDTGRDAIATANTPTYDELLETAAVGRLRADGPTVGLPEGYMGNSAVGHLTIGAGRAIDQPFARIERAIDEGTLVTNPALTYAFDTVEETGGTLHVWGLLSDGGVHAATRHFVAVIELAGERGISAVSHVVTDGRDTPPRCAKRFIPPLERAITSAKTGSIATVTGRYYAMDRDQRWERTRQAFEALVLGTGRRIARDAVAAIDRGYAVGESDEFIAPTVLPNAPQIEDGDVVFLLNFRADRARQLTRMLGGIDPAWSFTVEPATAEIVTMAEYDPTFDLPIAFEPIEPTDTLGSALAAAGLKQLRIAESEKYPHVTYFINGGREVEFPGEIREIVPSPSVATYDRKPEMNAPTVTDAALRIIEADDPDVLVLNYANPDMVGHTGDFEATVAAVEAVDTELGRLIRGLTGSHVLVIADHGNADDMGTPDEPHTAHTTNPVPCIYRSPAGDDAGYQIRKEGTLADVAPTLLTLLAVDVPDEMVGENLLT